MPRLEYLTDTQGKLFFINSLSPVTIKENNKQTTKKEKKKKQTKPPGASVKHITNSAFPGSLLIGIENKN